MSIVQEKIDALRAKLDAVQEGGGEALVEKQHKQGKMTARERLTALFDENSFVEIDQLVKPLYQLWSREKRITC